MIVDEEAHEKFFIRNVEGPGLSTLALFNQRVYRFPRAFSNNFVAGLVVIIADLTASISMGLLRVLRLSR
ncbi:MAG: hypothetical protein QW794_09185 [Thermosphaera sp.]